MSYLILTSYLLLRITSCMFPIFNLLNGVVKKVVKKRGLYHPRIYITKSDGILTA